MHTYYTTTGSVRGDCHHKHRTLGTAHRCLRTDQHDCGSVGGYSDRRVVIVEDGEQVELDGPDEYEDIIQ